MKYFKKDSEYIALEIYDLEYLGELGYEEVEEQEYSSKIEETNLSAAKEAKKNELLNSYNEAIKPYIIDTPDSEMLTWEKQESEAKAYKASANLDDAPLLKVLAESRGVELETFCNKVLEKSTLFREVSSRLIGKRQSLEDRVKLASSISEVEAIKWQEQEQEAQAEAQTSRTRRRKGTNRI